MEENKDKPKQSFKRLIDLHTMQNKEDRKANLRRFMILTIKYLIPVIIILLSLKTEFGRSILFKLIDKLSISLCSICK